MAEPARRFGLMTLAVLGVLAGFVAGIVLSELSGIVGVVVFDRAVGMKFLPFYLAVAFAIVVPGLAGRSRRRTRR